MKTVQGVLLAVAGALGAFYLPLAQAIPVAPVSYDMQNGQTGTFSYWDDSYTGSGGVTTDLAALSGGLGKLTDGEIAADSWYPAEAPYGKGVGGPYVGWRINPLIDFHFGDVVYIDTITFYVDDPDGYGNVWAPESFNIGGQLFSVIDPVGSGPTAYTFSGLDLYVSDLSVQINRKSGSDYYWVFVSEITFNDGVLVPAPSSIVLLFAGLLGIFVRRGRLSQG